MCQAAELQQHNAEKAQPRARESRGGGSSDQKSISERQMAKALPIVFHKLQIRCAAKSLHFGKKWKKQVTKNE